MNDDTTTPYGRDRGPAGIPASATDWSALEDECGSAEHVPALLDRFETDPQGVWSELMDHLCPQLDTAYSASYAALPRLAGIAGSCGPDRLVPVLLAAGAIASCAPGRRAGSEGPLDAHAAPLAVLRGLTEECLPRAATAPGGKADDTYVYLLMALLSFEGVELWDRHLEGIHMEEYEVDCPYCGVNMFIALGEDDRRARTDDDSPGTPLLPTPPHALDPLPSRLHRRARSDGRPDVAAALTHLFGRAICPDCGTEFPVAERVTSAW